jgi:hypothetical protein
MPGSLGGAVLAESRGTLQNALEKIEHCLDQLADADLWWRPHESHNSIQNIIIHLCGNLRQWIVHGVGAAPDDRNRPAEFADRRPIPKFELIGELRSAVAESVAAIQSCPESSLLERRRIQGFETTVLGALFDSVSHFVGHTHQIVYVTRLRLGDRYRFQWTPASPEQGG